MRSILIALFVLLTVPVLQARPQFGMIDSADPKLAPATCGYTVTYHEQEGTAHFSIQLDRFASTSFRKATVFFTTNVDGDPVIPVETTKDATGHISLTFAMPIILLKSCALQIDSDILRAIDPNYNFSGYRLRLDNFTDSNQESENAPKNQKSKTE